VVFERLPWRLLAPLQLIFVTAALLNIEKRDNASPAFAIIAVSALFAMTLPIVTAQAREAHGRIGRARAIDAEVADLQRATSPSLVVFYGSRFPREYWWRPFHHPGTELPAITLGWNNQNPQLQRFLAATGRQPLFRALCREPSMLLVADPDALGLITAYMREHFDTPVQWTKAYEGSFPAWRCSALGGHS
jgi:hypothetical protein